MNYPDNRRGIFVFSDAAGANSILSIIDVLITNDKKPGIDFLVFSDKKGKFDFEKYDFVIKLDFESKLISKYIENFNPDYIYTATSFHDYEHNWRKISSKKQIYTYGFIDHWIYYKKRFSFDGLTLYPSEVLVINEIAKNEAIKEGIPSDIIKVVGNPYYEKVKKYKPIYSKSSFKKYIGIKNDLKIITYVSENIRDDIIKDDSGNSILGFDEYETLENILITLHRVNQENKNYPKLNLIIKIHPVSCEKKFENILSKFKLDFLNIIVVKNFDSLVLCYYSDFILGMFSNMLIEALLMNKKVVRVQINEKIDLFKFNKVYSPSIRNLDDLYKNLENIIYE